MAQPPVFRAPVPNRTYNVSPAPRPRPEEDPDNFNRLGDAWQLSWMNQVVQKLEEEAMASDPNFVPSIPEGYEDYADSFKGAQSKYELETIKNNIDANMDARIRREKRGLGNTIVSDLVVGLADPTNLIAAPAMVGRGVIKGAAAGAAGVGSIGAVTEVGRVTLDPTAEPEEAVGGVVGSFTVGAGLGAGLGAIGRSTGRSTRTLGAKVQQQAAMPAQGPVTSSFGLRKAPIKGASRNHPGIDIGGKLGDPITAPLDGTVLKVGKGFNGGRGNYVEVDHGNGLVTRYFHMNDLSVEPGMRIRKGGKIGTIGSTGRSTGPHLHYEAVLNGKNIDPRQLGTREVRDAGEQVGNIDARRAGYVAEGIDPPAAVNFNGRGIKVVNAATGAVDAEGRPILAMFQRARERVIEPDGFGRAEVVTPDSPAAVREMTLDDLFGKGDPETEPVQAPPEAVTRARLATLDDGDDIFFSSLKPEAKGITAENAAAILKIAADDITNLGLKARGRLAKIIQANLVSEEQVSDFFGGAPPPKLTLKSIEERLTSEIKKRVTERENGKIAKPQPIRIDPDKSVPDYDPRRVQRLADEAYRERERLLKAAESKPPKVKAWMKEQAEKLLIKAEAYEAELSFSDGNWVRGVDDADETVFKPANDGPVLETADDALAELRKFDREKKRRDFDSGELADPVPAAKPTPEEAAKLRARQKDIVREINALEKGALDPMHPDYKMDLYRRLDRKEAKWREWRAIKAQLEAGDKAALPFSGNRAGPADVYDGEEDAIVLDIDGILNSFDEKPWTQAGVNGAAPLPEDAFADANEWLNFVYHHELEHTVNPARDGETVAAYEDRINQRALEEIRAGNLPLSPERSFFGNIAIAPLIHGQLDRIVPQEALIWEKVLQLSSDGAVTTIGGKGGRAAAPGGSVFQRRMLWEAEYGEWTASNDALWLNYVKGVAETPTSGKAATIKATLQRIGRQESGKMSRPQFVEAIGYAINRPDARTIEIDGQVFDIPPQVGEAVRRHQEAMERFEKAATEVGLFKMDKELDLQESWLNQRLTWADEQLARQLPDDARAFLEARKAAYQAELDSIAALRAQPRRPSGSENYQHRIWNMRALTDRKDEAIAMFAGVRKQRALDRNEVIDDATALRLAEDDYEAVLNAPIGDGVPGSPGATKGRTIDVTNAEAWEFIVKDPELNLAMYSRRMGAAIEMARTFGDARGHAVTDQIEADLLARGLSRDKVDRAMQLWFDQVDRVNGGFHGAGHMNLTNRIVRSLKQYVNLAAMGEAVKSQVPDLGRIIGTVGANPIMRQMVSAIQGDMRGLVADGSYAKQAGEAWDLATARAMAAIIDFDDYQLVTMQSGLERLLQKANPAFFIANLMTPWSILQKEFAGNMVPHLVLDKARQVAAAIRAGREPDAKMVEQLGLLNIDRVDAQILADMDVEQSPGGLMLPNLKAWAETGERGKRAAMLMRGAVNSEVRRMVPTPGPMDRPAVSDGVRHSKKGMREGRARVENARIKLAEATQELQRLRDESATDDMLEPAVEALSAARMELASAQAARPGAGRIEAPLLSLPFQFGSFLIGASGKITHGLISNRDGARTRALFTLLGAGIISTWWKTSDNPDENGVTDWDRMEWTEILWNGFDNSGALGYFHKVGPAAEATLKMGGVDLRGTDYDKNSWSQEIGTILGPVAGKITALYEAAAGLSDDRARVRAVRGALPVNNLIEVEGFVTDAERMLAGAGGPQQAELDDGPALRVKGDTTLDSMFGLGSEDLRRRPELVEEAPLYGGDTDDLDELVERIMARKKEKEGKLPRDRRQPAAEGALAAQP